MPFGQADVTVETVVNGLRFAGQYYDAETGLHYNYHRYYDPKLGRYLRADPIGLAGGVNLYAYVQNNPLNVFDFFGLLSQSYINKLGGGSNASSQWYNPSHSILGDWHSSNSTPEIVKAVESFPGGLALIPGGFKKAFGKRARGEACAAVFNKEVWETGIKPAVKVNMIALEVVTIKYGFIMAVELAPATVTYYALNPLTPVVGTEFAIGFIVPSPPMTPIEDMGWALRRYNDIAFFIFDE